MVKKIISLSLQSQQQLNQIRQQDAQRRAMNEIKFRTASPLRSSFDNTLTAQRRAGFSKKEIARATKNYQKNIKILNARRNFANRNFSQIQGMGQTRFSSEQMARQQHQNFMGHEEHPSQTARREFGVSASQQDYLPIKKWGDIFSDKTNFSGELSSTDDMWRI